MSFFKKDLVDRSNRTSPLPRGIDREIFAALRIPRLLTQKRTLSFLQGLLDMFTDIGISIKRPDHSILVANEKDAHIIGTAAGVSLLTEDVRDKRDRDFFASAPELIELFEREEQRVLAGESIVSDNDSVETNSSSRVCKDPIRGRSGKIVGIFNRTYDTTPDGRKDKELMQYLFNVQGLLKKYEDAHQLNDLLLRGYDSPVFIEDRATGRIVELNPYPVQKYFAMNAPDLVGRSIMDLVSPQWHDLLREDLTREYPSFSTETLLSIRGRESLVTIQIQNDSSFSRRVYTIHGLSTEKLDERTQLPTKDTFERWVEFSLCHAHALYARKDIAQGLVVMMIDMNGLHEIDRLMGHLFADGIIDRIAALLVEHFKRRSLDIVSRLYGNKGDEFGIMLYDCGSFEATSRYINSFLETAFGQGLSLSIGAVYFSSEDIAALPQPITAQTVRQILNFADKTLTTDVSKSVKDTRPLPKDMVTDSRHFRSAATIVKGLSSKLPAVPTMICP